MQMDTKTYFRLSGLVLVILFLIMIVLAITSCKKLEPLISTKVDPDTIKVVVKNSEDTTVRLDFYNEGKPDTVIVYDTTYITTFKGDTLYYRIKMRKDTL